jgi:hypothetical protein
MVQKLSPDVHTAYDLKKYINIDKFPHASELIREDLFSTHAVSRACTGRLATLWWSEQAIWDVAIWGRSPKELAGNFL